MPDIIERLIHLAAANHLNDEDSRTINDACREIADLRALVPDVTISDDKITINRAGNYHVKPDA